MIHPGRILSPTVRARRREGRPGICMPCPDSVPPLGPSIPRVDLEEIYPAARVHPCLSPRQYMSPSQVQPLAGGVGHYFTGTSINPYPPVSPFHDLREPHPYRIHSAREYKFPCLMLAIHMAPTRFRKSNCCLRMVALPPEDTMSYEQNQVSVVDFERTRPNISKCDR